MEVVCRLMLDELRREECSLAAVPREGETIALGMSGPEFRVDRVKLDTPAQW